MKAFLTVTKNYLDDLQLKFKKCNDNDSLEVFATYITLQYNLFSYLLHCM